MRKGSTTSEQELSYSGPCMILEGGLGRGIWLLTPLSY